MGFIHAHMFVQLLLRAVIDPAPTSNERRSLNNTLQNYLSFSLQLFQDKDTIYSLRTCILDSPSTLLRIVSLCRRANRTTGCGGMTLREIFAILQ